MASKTETIQDVRRKLQVERTAHKETKVQLEAMEETGMVLQSEVQDLLKEKLRLIAQVEELRIEKSALLNKAEEQAAKKTTYWEKTQALEKDIAVLTAALGIIGQNSR